MYTHRWIVRLLRWANVFPQTSHLYGLSPVCTHRWIVRLFAVGKRLPTDVTSVWFIPSVHSSAVECQMAGVRERLHYYTRYRQTVSPVILISWCDVTDGTGPATATGSVGGALGAAGVSVDGHRRRLRRRLGTQSTPKNTTTFRPNDCRKDMSCGMLFPCSEHARRFVRVSSATLATRMYAIIPFSRFSAEYIYNSFHRQDFFFAQITWARLIQRVLCYTTHCVLILILF